MRMSRGVLSGVLQYDRQWSRDFYKVWDSVKKRRENHHKQQCLLSIVSSKYHDIWKHSGLVSRSVTVTQDESTVMLAALCSLMWVQWLFVNKGDMISSMATITTDVADENIVCQTFWSFCTDKIITHISQACSDWELELKTCKASSPWCMLLPARFMRSCSFVF